MLYHSRPPKRTAGKSIKGSRDYTENENIQLSYQKIRSSSRNRKVINHFEATSTSPYLHSSPEQEPEMKRPYKAHLISGTWLQQ